MGDLEVPEFQPPKEIAELARWFAEGVQAELEALKKSGGEQIHEVHSGKLIERISSELGIFTFLIADGTRLPEDASGRLRADKRDFIATVIGQNGNIIHLQLEGDSLPTSIYRAKLSIEDTALLQRLAQVL
jgi:hypothetical protein